MQLIFWKLPCIVDSGKDGSVRIAFSIWPVLNLQGRKTTYFYWKLHVLIWAEVGLSKRMAADSINGWMSHTVKIERKDSQQLQRCKNKCISTTPTLSSWQMELLFFRCLNLGLLFYSIDKHIEDGTTVVDSGCIAHSRGLGGLRVSSSCRDPLSHTGANLPTPLIWVRISWLLTFFSTSFWLMWMLKMYGKCIMRSKILCRLLCRDKIYLSTLFSQR